MLFIIGLEVVLHGLAQLLPPSVGDTLRRQMGHVAWEGLSVYDLIFPLFVFISGVSLCFALDSAQRRGVSPRHTGLRLWRRAAVLVLLGILVNMEARWGISNLRYASVLGLIGISCALTGSLALALRKGWMRLAAAGGILACVWCVQHYGGDASPAGSVNAWIDAHYCPGRLHLGVLDPEGPLCIISATALCLIGLSVGELLKSGASSRLRTSGIMLGAGGMMLLLGLHSGAIIKNIWTPAFVLCSAGISCLLLALFHYLFDTEKGASYCIPLRIVGINALFIYTFTHVLCILPWVRELVMVDYLASLVPQSAHLLIVGCCYLGINWCICLYMWRRHIVIKA